VGCNIGIISQYLLDAGIADRVTGIELFSETVSNSLRQNPRFTLIEGDIARLDLDARFDVCIYGAVHHHVLGRYGLGKSISVLQKITNACSQTLFLETGHLAEGARWPWQREMRRYFRSDEEHMYYLLSSIEHSIDDFHIVGRYWIHGIRRWFVKIDLKPFERRKLKWPTDTRICLRDEGSALFGRTFGSRNQTLVPSTEDQAKDSPTLFRIGRSVEGQKLFLKHHVHSPAASLKELTICMQMSQHWAVRCLGLSGETPALVFPFIAAFQNIDQVRDESRKLRRCIADRLLALHAEAKQTPVHIEAQTLLPCHSPVTLLETCDFGQNNLLIVQHEGAVKILVVDFEQQSCRYGWRNRMHLARMLFQLGQHRFRASFEFALGASRLLLLLIQYQFLPIKARIRDRQPALLSLLVTEFRSKTGAIMGRVLRLVGYE
jgi:hypothetical protein